MVSDWDKNKQKTLGPFEYKGHFDPNWRLEAFKALQFAFRYKWLQLKLPIAKKPYN